VLKETKKKVKESPYWVEEVKKLSIRNTASRTSTVPNKVRRRGRKEALTSVTARKIENREKVPDQRKRTSHPNCAPEKVGLGLGKKRGDKKTSFWAKVPGY